MNKKVYQKFIDEGYNVKPSDDKIYDFIVLEDEPIYVKIFKAPRMANITINNKYMWQILDGKKQMRFVHKTERFMNDNKKRKVILFLSVSNLRKWINECEMIQITPEVDIYGARIVALNRDEFKKLKWED